jgi:hypothetical protein
VFGLDRTANAPQQALVQSSEQVDAAIARLLAERTETATPP